MKTYELRVNGLNQKLEVISNECELWMFDNIEEVNQFAIDNKIEILNKETLEVIK